MCDYIDKSDFEEFHAEMQAWQEGRGDDTAYIKELVTQLNIRHAEMYQGEYDFPENFPRFDPTWPRPMRDTWFRCAVQCCGFMLTVREWKEKNPLLHRKFDLA